MNQNNDHPDMFRQQVDRVREGAVLGRSSLMRGLFDYLVRCAETGETPREMDIAVEVFGRSGGFDVSQDASVRVYIHRLRQKLDDFYADGGREAAHRLVIPKGDYRLTLEEQAPAAAEQPAQEAQGRRPRALTGWGVAAAVMLLLLANAGIWMAFWPRAADDNLAQVRQSGLWAPLLEGQRLNIVAVGDYYIFGELGDTLNVDRLVREFSINSREDLFEHQVIYPETAARYVDMGLRYLPTATAHALARVIPIISPSSRAGERVRVMLSSQLTPGMIKSANIIYVGYLSALGPLREPLFAGSRFSVGDTYDEIIDNETGKRYLSEINRYQQEGRTTLDYGLISTFQGPTGNRIIILAGTRDVAIRQVAEEATDSKALARLRPAGGQNAFEALFEVEAMEQYNMGAALVTTAPLDQGAIWTGGESQIFPAQ